MFAGCGKESVKRKIVFKCGEEAGDSSWMKGIPGRWAQALWRGHPGMRSPGFISEPRKRMMRAGDLDESAGG